MSRYRWSEKAAADVAQISERIARDNPNAALRWLDDIFNACQRAADFHEIGPARDELAPGLRSIPIGNYVLFYRAVGEDLVLIVRVYHGAQDLPRVFEE